MWACSQIWIASYISNQKGGSHCGLDNMGEQQHDFMRAQHRLAFVCKTEEEEFPQVKYKRNRSLSLCFGVSFLHAIRKTLVSRMAHSLDVLTSFTMYSYNSKVAKGSSYRTCQAGWGGENLDRNK